jgi:hypothetical protein
MLSPGSLPADALRAGAAYLRRNPTELFTVARNAAGFRVAVPLDALRWLVEKLVHGKRAPKELTLGTAPPALSLSMLAEVMGNGLRASADVAIDELRLSPEELRIVLRLSHVKLNAVNPESPMAQMVKALDTSKPASLLNFMPKKPAAIVEAVNDRITLDLMRVEKLAHNPVFKRVLNVLSPVLGDAGAVEISTDQDHLVVAFKPRFGGVASAVRAITRR